MFHISVHFEIQDHIIAFCRQNMSWYYGGDENEFCKFVMPHNKYTAYEKIYAIYVWKKLGNWVGEI